ncbi:MAG: putative transporter [Bacteroidales bacterium]
MEWLGELFSVESIAQSIVLLALTVALGLLLSKIKIANISFGITWILFAGIAISHFGLRVESGILHFIKEFGLILFVFSIGLQVGPGFFSSFKKGGIKLNMLALMVVFLGVVITVVLHFVTQLPISTMVGVMSGAITNTPGLGAAQQTYLDMNGTLDPSIAMGYAVAYPLGVLGIIFSILVLKGLFRIDFKKELKEIEEGAGQSDENSIKLSVVVQNPSVFGKSIMAIKSLIDRDFIISRVISQSGTMDIARATTVLEEDERLLIITNLRERDAVVAFFGKEIPFDQREWSALESNIIPSKVIVTKDRVNGKSLADLNLGSSFGITVTRINRSGVELVAQPNLKLQMGDSLTVVGREESIKSASQFLGNSPQRLSEPNLATIFIGIVLGIVVGSIPLFIPNIPQPVKLGLAGGPLIVAILISRFGPKFNLITYTTVSANLMLREVGIALFLACVGLGAGENFVDTIVHQGGAIWILYGVIITVLPLLIVGVVARKFFKLNFYTLMGLIAGSTTDPPALSYAGVVAGNNYPAVAYASVYPLTMFLRVLFAQLLILIFL